ncbi:tRNA (adenosine(37)-N6)-threonylcarbamoyltransferase complex dimerization subunit type 1 TsaB [Permianibacter sp. IMCC34836]|uniref:tRNA (adenosine(37)-N6)-threonylcarbamoyltransferase complex dimerization subunit type 1 TsaB n=1 Tax=Permianibacter fluminis TaxID=2738515 RepID=UPI00155481A3|nr:tRNA (adenosine(37)-N6)-threonylcarbamoyltransferase complex dimerization subunit type 1 TsaB [Permianibacter fluminis]NQD37707.1 tRNA (adenosine(37)-N6)-threonylcarbamoyltransferase complex dimerization subunit type 1 TsaB [Permianibacter fluminis]
MTASLKNVLALDTATEALSVALQFGDQLVGHYEVAPRLHAQKILPLIDSVLAQAGLRIADIDAFVFGRGPGAFTGVRTAVAVVQGLAFSHDKPVLGVSTLLAMAEGARRQHGVTQVLTAIDARMGEIYAAAYRHDGKEWQLVLPEAVMAPAQLKFAEAGDWFACGTGWQAHGEQLRAGVRAHLQLEPGEGRLPDARDMLALALPALARGEGLPADQALPVYLRDQVADKPKPKA